MIYKVGNFGSIRVSIDLCRGGREDEAELTSDVDDEKLAHYSRVSMRMTACMGRWDILGVAKK